MCTMRGHHNCGPLCLYRVMPFLEGFVVIVLGVFLFMTNYGFLNAEIWKWLFPLVIMLVGFKWITNGSHEADCDDMMIDDYDVMCCDDEGCRCDGSCECDEDAKGCGCEGSCTCRVEKSEMMETGCGCGGGCGCGDRMVDREDTTGMMKK
ncbi:MAG: hypothetical protein KIH62_005185 [Candidatus Kerfeldbacteria bacterium]|nr:hypothetical protein [Candidatus Kerfeldbacteria bacterium]